MTQQTLLEGGNVKSDKPKTLIAADSHGLRFTSLDDAWRFAQCVVESKLAPQSFDTPAKVLVAMQYGWELGLGHMQSLQTIAVINGRPCIWGDALPALCYRSGKVEYLKESIDGEGDKMVATCTAKRQGVSQPKTATFSVEDAKRAGLWNKKGPWQTYPKRMLQIRARAFCLRDLFADLLAGFGVIEELQDVPAVERETVPVALAAPGECLDLDELQ